MQLGEVVDLSAVYTVLVGAGIAFVIGLVRSDFPENKNRRLLIAGTVTAFWTMGALVLLLFGVAVGLYSIGSISAHMKKVPTQPWDLEMAWMPLLSITVMIPCFYLLAGTRRWLARISIVASGLGLLIGIVLISLGLLSIHFMQDKDELSAGCGSTCYYAFLLVGVLLKGRGIWFKKLPPKPFVVPPL